MRVGLRHPCEPDQNQEIGQHIDKHWNKGDCEHRDLGEKEPPEDFSVAERTEPQQFRRPVDERQPDDKKASAKQPQAHGRKEQAARGTR